MKSRFLTSFTVVLVLAATPLLALAGDKSDSQPQASENPPPKTTLDNFQRFEMDPVAMGAPFAGQGREAAVAGQSGPARETTPRRMECQARGRYATHSEDSAVDSL